MSTLLTTIAVFGDSILRGTVISPQTGRYVFRDHELYAPAFEKYPVVLDNHSRFGCTCEKGAVFLNKYLEQPEISQAVLLEYGGNDSNFLWKEVAADPEGTHLPITSPERYEELMTQMVNAVRQRGAQPVMMSLPPVDAHKYLAWMGKAGLNVSNILRWLGDVDVIYRFQEMYSAAATRVAHSAQCLFIDVRRYFLDKHNYLQLLCEDGLHPSEEGHRLIARAFTDYLDRQLISL